MAAWRRGGDASGQKSGVCGFPLYTQRAGHARNAPFQENDIMGDADETPYHNEAILAHPREARLLLLASVDGWTLPTFDATESPAIVRALRERLGVETIVLRRVYDRARFAPEAR